MRIPSVYVAVAGLCALAACGGGAGSAPEPPTPTPTPTPIAVTAADRQYCVDRINALRATIGRRGLRRGTALEAFGDAAAANDGQTGVSHQHGQATNGGGVSLAENEVISWSVTQFGSVQGVVKAANEDLFWAEGPGGGHYQNIANAQWTQVGCGFYVSGSSVTYTTEFR